MSIRRYNDHDEAEVVALWNRAWWADKTTPEFFREKILLEPNIGEEGFFLAEEQGGIVGAVNAFVRSTDLPWGYGGASAALKGKGFLLPLLPSAACGEAGRELLAAAEDYLRQRRRTLVSVCEYYPLFYPDGVDQARYPALHGFLLENGYRHHDTTYSMSCDLRDHRYPEKAHCLERQLGEQGITFTSYRPEHLLPIKRFLLREFPSWVSCFANKVAQRSPGHEIMLALADGEVVAYCQYRYYGLAERVGPFGVSAALRGAGVGYVLVARLLQNMAECGFQAAYFCTAGERQAKFYAKNGFVVYREKTVFEKILS